MKVIERKKNIMALPSKTTKPALTLMQLKEALAALGATDKKALIEQIQEEEQQATLAELEPLKEKVKELWAELEPIVKQIQDVDDSFIAPWRSKRLDIFIKGLLEANPNISKGGIVDAIKADDEFKPKQKTDDAIQKALKDGFTLNDNGTYSVNKRTRGAKDS